MIPASIDDGFASQWKELVEEHLPGQNQYEILRRNIIDRVADDYDFIFIDTGPHTDPFLLNGLAASDFAAYPYPTSPG